MLCVSLAERSAAAVVKALRGRPFAEIRLEAIEDLTEAGIRTIFSGPGRKIATFRPGRVPEKARLRLLRAAVRAGAEYVDLEMESLGEESRKLIREAKRRRCRMIISYHDAKGTPPRAALERLRSLAFAAGADIFKIACRSRNGRDNARLLGLLDDPRPTIVVGMGPKGVITRIAAPGLGAPFTYASPAPGRQTAPGQIPATVLSRVWKAIEHA